MHLPCVGVEVEANDEVEGVGRLQDDDDIEMPTSKGTR